MNPILFLSTVIIWGTTWIAIALQVGPVPVLTSIFYRFGLAAILFLAVLALTGRLTFPQKQHHIWLVTQALCLFSLNFICFYNATSFIPSGLVSIIFSLATMFNALHARLFFGDRITKKVLLASILGILGLTFIFSHDILALQSQDTIKGVLLAGLGTMFFSLGNMVSRRNSQAGISPMIANAWAMGYGAVILVCLIGVTNTPVVLPTDITYLGALFFLATFGSIVGFTTYLMLVARIGSAKAAYATVLFPIIALALSTIFEGYEWHWTAVVGLILALLGNVVMFIRIKDRQATRSQQPMNDDKLAPAK